MRIGIVTETYSPEINGVALTVAGLARGLADAGHGVQLIRPRQEHDASAVAPEAGIETVLVRGMRLPRYPGLQFGLPARRRLQGLWKHQRPDAIYVATEGPLGSSALRAAQALGIPSTTGFHTRFDDFSGHYGLGIFAPLVLRYLRRFHRRSRATFVPTVELVEFLKASGFGNVVRLPRAVDATLFSPTRRDPALRATWGVGAKQPVVIYVGRIAAEKNLPLAVRSFRAIQQVRPDARYVWVGDGPARAALAAQNRDFIFAGAQHGEALARYYASADIFVFPSLTETFGNVTLEALASGLPTLAFDYGAAREHLTAASGRAVRFGDEFAFVRAAQELVRNRETLDAMRAAARATVAGLSLPSVTAHFAQALAAVANAAAISASGPDASAIAAAESATSADAAVQLPRGAA
jgi:glycosyltransferase involved in cell wall biosynthesis